MTQTKLEYVGAARSLPAPPAKKWWQKTPLSLIVVVGVSAAVSMLLGEGGRWITAQRIEVSGGMFV